MEYVAHTVAGIHKTVAANFVGQGFNKDGGVIDLGVLMG